MKKLAGLEIHVRKEKDDGRWAGFVRSGNYQSQTWNHYACRDELEATRKTLEEFLEGPAVELAMTKQLWFTFNEELTT